MSSELMRNCTSSEIITTASGGAASRIARTVVLTCNRSLPPADFKQNNYVVCQVSHHVTLIMYISTLAWASRPPFPSFQRHTYTHIQTHTSLALPQITWVGALRIVSPSV